MKLDRGLTFKINQPIRVNVFFLSKKLSKSWRLSKKKVENANCKNVAGYVF